jgi:hypothetical protein
MLNLINEVNIILNKLNEEKIEYALCGGLAVAVYGFVRATIDIDLLILSNDLVRIKNMLTKVGYTLDAMPMHFSENKIQIERVTKIEKETGDYISVDLLLVTQEISNIWTSKQKISWNNQDVYVVSKDGLIEMKKLRNSKQDQADIENLSGDNTNGS